MSGWLSVTGFCFQPPTLSCQNLTCHPNDSDALEDFMNCLQSTTGGWDRNFPDNCCKWAVEALKEIGKELGKSDWNFEEDPCNNKPSWAIPVPKSDDGRSSMNIVTCSCPFPGETYHVISITLQGQDLPGILPTSIVKLPYLTYLDLNRNYLRMPIQWASTKLEHLYHSFTCSDLNRNYLRMPIQWASTKLEHL